MGAAVAVNIASSDVNVEYDRRGIPMIGDIVILHWGDDGEKEERYIVCRREFDVRDLDRIVFIVERHEV